MDIQLLRYYVRMDGMTTPARVWIAACSHRLQRQWRTVDPVTLEDVASELWADERLRALDPVEAAAAWLRQGLPHVA